MPKIQTEDATSTVAEQPAIPRKYGVDVLPDGRVRATIVGLYEETDELNYACSQERTVKFMLNDVAPEIK